MLRKACVWRWSRYSWSSEPTFTLEINITGNPWTTPHRDLPLQPAYSLMRVSLRTRGCTESSCKQCSTVQHQQEAREHHFSLRKLVSHSWLSLLEPLHWKGSKEANAYRRNVISSIYYEPWDLTDFLWFDWFSSRSSESAAAQQVGSEEEARHHGSKCHRPAGHTQTDHQLSLLPVRVTWRSSWIEDGLEPDCTAKVLLR